MGELVSPAAGEPSHSLEIEVKFDVDDDTPLPDFSTVPGVVVVADVEVRELDAVYFDTSGLDLASAAVALRRRTGGPDAGWHVKTSAAEGRHEYGWPLEGGVLEPHEISVPSAVADAVSKWSGGAALAPLARLRNSRHAYALRDASSAVIAEFTDDHVDASALRTGTSTSWREWEIELGAAAPVDEAGRSAVFAAVVVAVTAVGARAAASDSKLARALGR